MPFGFQRLNERHQRPNSLINFIKILPSSTLSAPSSSQITSQDYLERIAAQCYPVMRQHHISVMSLEEYPPNPEFLGRNFNAGEIIQLVLKDKRGNWLPFRFVQMVMMHELAHCKQMNHSRAFWGVRNEFADEMKVLWGKKYTGEGVWGRGRDLESGGFVFGSGRVPDQGDVPEHLCGGTYRSRGRKRKRGVDSTQKLSYAERQQKRIARKFGVHGDGNAVGDDELVRGALESGPGKKRGQGKPKVASSKRGRELRASAALARFEAAQGQTKEVKPKKEEDGEGILSWIKTEPSDHEQGFETESDDDYDGNLDNFTEVKNEIDIPKDSGLIRVCGDENDKDDGDDIRNEMTELRQMNQETPSNSIGRSNNMSRLEAGSHHTESYSNTRPQSQSSTESEIESETHLTDAQQIHKPQANHPESLPEQVPKSHSTPDTGAEQSGASCPICSLTNPTHSPTCLACAHVLQPRLVLSHWRCQSTECRSSSYINAGDAGRCGICGQPKPREESNSYAEAVKPSRREQSGARSEQVLRPGERAMGATKGEILRWD